METIWTYNLVLSVHPLNTYSYQSCRFIEEHYILGTYQMPNHMHLSGFENLKYWALFLDKHGKPSNLHHRQTITTPRLYKVEQILNFVGTKCPNHKTSCQPLTLSLLMLDFLAWGDLNIITGRKFIYIWCFQNGHFVQFDTWLIGLLLIMLALEFPIM